jgi:hypothetical protein
MAMYDVILKDLGKDLQTVEDHSFYIKSYAYLGWRGTSQIKQHYHMAERLNIPWKTYVLESLKRMHAVDKSRILVLKEELLL